MGKDRDQLKSGVILSYINLVLSSVIPMLYTPAMLRLIGQEEYGLYSLSATAVGYLALLSFGFGGTVLRYLSLYRAKGQVEEERRAFGFFLVVYSAIAILVMVGGVFLSQHVQDIFHRSLSDNELSKMSTLMLIMAASSAVTFPISAFSSVVMAHERYTFRKIVDMAATVATPIANLIALYLGYASVGMAVASFALHVVLLPINMYYCFAILEIRPSFRRIPGDLIREMLGFSAYVFLATIVDMLFWATDKLLLGMYIGTAAVAVYNIGSTFNSMVMNLSGAISNVMAPRVTAMVAQEKTSEEMTTLFIRTGRLQYLIVALVISGFCVYGQAFIRLWVGESYLEAYWIAIMTMVPLCIPLIQNVGISVVMAQNKHAFRSVTYLVIAVINVISTAMIIPHWGGRGAAFCSGLSYLVGQGVIMNLYYWKRVGIDIPRFWREILRMSLVPGIMLAAALLIGRTVRISSWPAFFGVVALYVVIYALGMYRFGLNEEEKKLIWQAVEKVKRR